MCVDWLERATFYMMNTMNNEQTLGPWAFGEHEVRASCKRRDIEIDDSVMKQVCLLCLTHSLKQQAMLISRVGARRDKNQGQPANIASSTGSSHCQQQTWTDYREALPLHFHYDILYQK